VSTRQAEQHRGTGTQRSEGDWGTDASTGSFATPILVRAHRPHAGRATLTATSVLQTRAVFAACAKPDGVTHRHAERTKHKGRKRQRPPRATGTAHSDIASLAAAHAADARGWKKEPRNLGTDEEAVLIDPSPGMLPLALTGSSLPGFLIKSDTLGPVRPKAVARARSTRGLYYQPSKSAQRAQILPLEQAWVVWACRCGPPLQSSEGSARLDRSDSGGGNENHEGSKTRRSSRDAAHERRAGSSVPLLRAFAPSWSLLNMTRAAACARLVAAWSRAEPLCPCALFSGAT